MAGDKDDDGNNNDSWSWKELENIKAEHDRLSSELRGHTDDPNDKSGNSHNPFSAFKRFVDSNISSIQSALDSLPSNVADFKANMQREEERWREEELEISSRWTGSSDTQDHIQMELSRSSEEERKDAHSATISLLTEALRKNAHVPHERIRALFEDKESTLREMDRFVNPILAMGGAWFFTPETGDRIPVGRDQWAWKTPSPRWLSVDWFKRSPYSPVRLEAYPGLEEAGTNWRAAFEDLMDASLDKPMSSREYVGRREPHGKPQSTYYGPGLEWMLSLQCRGVLPPLLPRFYNDKSSLTGIRGVPNLLQTKRDVPWSHEGSLAFHSTLSKDFSDLISEVATKSTSDSHASPLDMPGTEQDLYDSPYLMREAQIGRSTVMEDDRDDEDYAQDSHGNHALEDHATQLMQLEQQNKERLLSGHRRSDCVARPEDDKDDEADVFGGDEVDDNVIGRASNLKSAVLAEMDHLIDQSLLTDINHTATRILDAIYEAYEDKEGCPSQWVKDESSFDQKRRAELMKRAEELEQNVPEVWRLLPVQVLGLAVEQLEYNKAREDEEWQNILEMTGGKQHKPVTQEKPSVLSALTTTRTTRLPDGTVTTEVVLKKRFSDGTETTEESVHTSNENLEKQRQEEQQREEETHKKKGWFWT